MSLHPPEQRVGRIATQRPNWAGPVTETYSFRTRIETFRNGVEQRVCQRFWPRVNIAFRADQMGLRASRIRSDAQSMAALGDLVLPIGWRSRPLIADAETDGTTLTIADTPWWVRVGSWLVLDSGEAKEAVQVDAVSDGEITLVDPLINNHPTGAAVCWGLPGAQPKKQGLRSLTATHFNQTYQFEGDAGYLDGAPTPFELHYYDQHPIFPLRANWLQDVKTDLADMRETTDFEYGVSDKYWFNEHLEHAISWTYTAFSQTAVDEFLGFFFHVKGRQRPFWASSLRRDFELAFDAEVGATELVVRGNEYPVYADDPVHNTVIVQWPGGCYQIRTIESITSDGDTSTIAFSGEWARAIDDAAMISWCFLSRFQSDDLEIGWQTSEVANISVGTQSLRGFEPEVIGSEPATVQFVPSPVLLTGFDNPELHPFGTIALGDLGVSPEMVATGVVIANVSLSAHIPDTGSQSFQVGVRLWCFDENDEEIVPDDQIRGLTENLNREGTAMEFTTTLPQAVVVPEGTAYLRFRTFLNRNYTTQESLGIVVVSPTTPGAGGELICP